MTDEKVGFVVEQAGCTSCAELIREALGQMGRVECVQVDEAADEAAVRIAPAGSVSEADVGRILAVLSVDSGHAYRIRPGSWTALQV